MPIRYRSVMILAVVLFGQLLLMAYQLRRNQDIPLVRGSVVYLVAPLQRAANAVVSSMRGVWEGYIYLWGTRRQNQTLQTEIGNLKIENQRLREQAEEGRRLQVLFNLRQQVQLPTAAAQVLSTGSSETARVVLIDKGANAGLKPDFPVMVPDGVVGKVLHVFPYTAQVLLVTDPYSGVACLLENSRVHGILKGQNKPVATLTYVQNGEEVKTGQRVFTSGEDQIYPKGLPVGIVLDAKPGPEFQQITVQPLAPLNRLEDVLVILQSGGDLGQTFMAAEAAPVSNPPPAAPPPPQNPPASGAAPMPAPNPKPVAPSVPVSSPVAVPAPPVSPKPIVPTPQSQPSLPVQATPSQPAPPVAPASPPPQTTPEVLAPKPPRPPTGATQTPLSP